MNPETPLDAWLRRRIARYLADQDVPEGDHLADDPDLLADWSAGALDPREQLRFADHLVRCPECRQVVALLLEAGELRFPEDPQEESPSASRAAGPLTIHEPQSPPATIRPPDVSRRSIASGRFGGWIAAAIAAAVLIVVWIGLRPTTERRIADLERRGREVPSDGVLTDAESLLPALSKESDRERVLTVIGDVARSLGEGRLERGEFDDARRLADRARAAGADGGAIRALALQAAAERRSIVEPVGEMNLFSNFAFDLLGSIPIKGIEDPGGEEARLRQEYRAAVEAFPDSYELRIDYGRNLLTAGLWDEALAQFEAARTLRAEDLDATMGIGMSQAGAKRWAEAEEAFRVVVRSLPGYGPAKLNLAIALEAQGRTDESQPLWRELLLEPVSEGDPLEPDLERLRQAIESLD